MPKGLIAHCVEDVSISNYVEIMFAMCFFLYIFMCSKNDSIVNFKEGDLISSDHVFCYVLFFGPFPFLRSNFFMVMFPLTVILSVGFAQPRSKFGPLTKKGSPSVKIPFKI